MRLFFIDCEKCRFAYKCSDGKDGGFWWHVIYHIKIINELIWFFPFWFDVFRDFFQYWALAEYCGKRRIQNIKDIHRDFKLSYDLARMRY